MKLSGKSITLILTICSSYLCGIAIAALAQGGLEKNHHSSADLLLQINDSRSRAAMFLCSKQSQDGAWRSETYGMFRKGITLTPYVMSSLFFNRPGGIKARRAFRKGVLYLLSLVDQDGTTLKEKPESLIFPVLNAASASRMVVLEQQDALNVQAQTAFLEVIKSYQLTEVLGWTIDDSDYGGWGFSIKQPWKPGPGKLRDLFFESNMVATIFGIAALRSARVPATDPCWSKALVFVQRCQNFAHDRGDPNFDDGGFFFRPADAVQNKAGPAGTDRLGQQRFHSYGTMTADGMRALVQCGLPQDHPRVQAALKWLYKHFSSQNNPGTFIPERAVLRNATYYYWAWAVAHAFSRMGIRQFEQNGETIQWAQTLARELLKRQKENGSWSNVYTDAKEDDPLIATPWASATLSICSHVLTAKTDQEIPRFTKPQFPLD